MNEKSHQIVWRQFTRKIGICISVFSLVILLLSCGDGNEIPDPNPGGGSGKIDVTIDLNSTTYSALKTKGGSAVVSTQNIIAAHTTNDTWIAVGSKCTNDQTILTYRAGTNDFVCPQDASEFKGDGSVQKGPASAALKKYGTSYDASNSTLRIFE